MLGMATPACMSLIAINSSPCPSSRIKVVRKYFDFVEI